MLDWLVPVKNDDGAKTRIESFMGELPKFAKNLKTFGEAVVIKIKSDNWPAVRDRSVTCFMAGYCLQHTGDTYKMYNPLENVLYDTRDIIWLKRMFFRPIAMPPVYI